MSTDEKTQQPIVVNVINNNNNTNTNTNYNQSSTATKSKWVAFFLCLFLGGLGFHRFYLGKIGTGILYLFTGGFLGIGWLVDLITILLNGCRDKWGCPLR